jgi:epoxyqueuosine reductase QueG
MDEAGSRALAGAVRSAAAATVAAGGAEREAEGLPRLWRQPLVGFASASDPRFPELRRVALEDHLLPVDLLPDALSVVAFFVPFVREVGDGNAGGRHASELWADAYIHTNLLIGRISAAITAILQAEGHAAEAVRATHNFDPLLLVSRWSHRHVARIAGLGEFGLNNMLITEKGAAGRFGSLATDAPLPPTATDLGPDPAERRAGHPCLFRRNGACGLCVARCPTGALRPDGFDRHLCYGLCLENAERHRTLGLADVCGKCVSGLPCSYRE